MANLIRVQCYNIHHGEGTDQKVDLPRLAQVISKLKPDLVALQEVDQGTKRTGQVDQPAELARLTGLHGIFGKQIPYQGGSYGQAILARSKPEHPKVHLLPGEPNREQRIAFEVTVTFAGQPIVFASTHLHHQSATFREQQAKTINQVFADRTTPMILAGDLNANPDSSVLAIIDQHWQRATLGKPLLTFPADKPTKQIDYILFRPAHRFKVKQVMVIEEGVASDHRPIFAELEFTPGI